MREVASLAGVSIKTVSRVINTEPGVSPDVRARVDKAALQLGYRHNLAASNLRRAGSRTDTVGVLLQDISNSFSASLLRALEDAGRDRGIAVLASSLDEESERERSLVANLVRRRVDGLVIMPSTERQDYLAEDVNGGLPTVFVDRRPRGVDVDSVTVDNRHGGRLAGNHLLLQGHRRIAFLGDSLSIQTAKDRYDGFAAALVAAGVELDPRITFTGLRDGEPAREAVEALMRSACPPTAIFAARNTVAIGAIRGLRFTGHSRDVALVGFDDFPLADVIEPPLTVIRQDVWRMGHEVGQQLFARIDGKDDAPEHIVIEPTLVQRGSGEVDPPAG